MAIRTLNQIIGEFQEIANQHRQINNFTVGTIEDFATSGTTNYPCWWVSYQNNGFEDRRENFSFTFWVLDRVKKDRSNLIEIHSDCKQIAMDIIAQLNDAMYKWSIDQNITLSAIYEPFHEDELAGWTFDVTISQPFIKDVCQIPFIEPITVGRSQSGYNPNTLVNDNLKLYGSFYDTTTQSHAIDSIAAMTYNTTDSSATYGISIENNSQITVTKSGVYNIQFSGQFERQQGGGGSAKQIVVWLRKNGVDVANSATHLTVVSNDKYLVGAWNFYISLNANEHAEIMWSQDDNIVLKYESANNTIPYPAVPSVILTINQIN